MIWEFSSTQPPTSKGKLQNRKYNQIIFPSTLWGSKLFNIIDVGVGS